MCQSVSNYLRATVGIVVLVTTLWLGGGVVAEVSAVSSSAVLENSSTSFDGSTAEWENSSTTTTVPSTADNTIKVVYEIERTPEDKSTIRVHYTVEIPSNVDEVRISLDNLQVPYTFESGDGTTYNSTTGVATAQSARGTQTNAEMTYTVKSNRTSFGGYDTVETVDWAFIGGGQTTEYHRWSYFGESPSFDVDYAVVGSGYAADGFAFLGSVTTYNQTTNGQSFTLVVPDAASPSTAPDTVLDGLENASRMMKVGDRDSAVTAFVAPDPLREGGKAGGQTFWAHEQSSLMVGSTWYHEYVHTRQAWIDGDSSLRTSDDIEWLTEASADYYAGYLGWQTSADDVNTFRAYVATDRYANEVLQDADGQSTENKNYYKGRRVLAALDIRIHKHTDGNETLMDVFREVNSSPSDKIQYTDFREEVVDKTNETTGDWLDTQVQTSSAPSIPSSSGIETAYNADSGSESTLEVSLSPATITANESAMVTTTVADNDTGTAVEGATVAIGELGLSETTDANGEATLSFTDPGAGEYTMSVTADGFSEATETLTVEKQDNDGSGGSEDGNQSQAETLTLNAADVPGAVQPGSTFNATYEIENTGTDITAYTFEMRTNRSNVTVSDFSGDIRASDVGSQPPSASTEAIDTGETATVTVSYRVVANTTGNANLTAEAQDPLSGANTTVSQTLAIKPVTITDPRKRVLLITGKNDPSDLTQNDVTAVITRFNRGGSVNGIDITQNDVTATISLFSRN